MTALSPGAALTQRRTGPGAQAQKSPPSATRQLSTLPSATRDPREGRQGQRLWPDSGSGYNRRLISYGTVTTPTVGCVLVRDIPVEGRWPGGKTSEAHSASLYKLPVSPPPLATKMLRTMHHLELCVHSSERWEDEDGAAETAVGVQGT